MRKTTHHAARLGPERRFVVKFPFTQAPTRFGPTLLTDEAVVTDALNEYLGNFQMAPRKVVTINADGESLTGQLTGQPALPLQKDDEDTYSVIKTDMVPVDMTLAFGRNDQGIIDHLIVKQGDHEVRGEKLHADARPLTGDLETLQGNWIGSIGLPGRKMRIGLSFFANGDDSLGAYIMSPDQGVSYIPVSQVSYADNTVTLQSNDVQAAYEGLLKIKKGRIVSIKGKWQQRDQSATLKLEPVSV